MKENVTISTNDAFRKLKRSYVFSSKELTVKYRYSCRSHKRWAISMGLQHTRIGSNHYCSPLENICLFEFMPECTCLRKIWRRALVQHRTKIPLVFLVWNSNTLKPEVIRWSLITSLLFKTTYITYYFLFRIVSKDKSLRLRAVERR